MRRSRAAVLCGVIALGAGARRSAAATPLPSAAAPTPFYNGPYLQRLAATSVEVRVELDAPAAASLEVEGGAFHKRTIGSRSSTFHVFFLDGLSPQTTYHYVVRAGAFESPLGQFVTAPADDSGAPLSFVVYGDNRSNDREHAAVVRAVQAQSVDFLVNTGDFVAAGSDKAQWHAFFAVESDLLRDHCVFACIGNHELYEDEAATNFVTYFGPHDVADAGPVRLYGTFRWSGARFFLLNAFQDWSKGELAWLERELGKADSEPGVGARFVVTHRSPWSSGHHGDDAKALAAGVPDLLVKHHVDVVFAGHDHMYERGEWKGLKYVISGGGGAPLYPDITAKSSTRRAEAAFNFVRVSVDGGTVKLIAQRPDGSTIESCGFRRGESWDCDSSAGKPGAAVAPPGEAPPPPQAPTPSTSDAGGKSSRCACDVLGRRGDRRSRDGSLSGFALAVLVIAGRRALRRERR